MTQELKEKLSRLDEDASRLGNLITERTANAWKCAAEHKNWMRELLAARNASRELTDRINATIEGSGEA
jgi:hypothetical protein